MGEGNKYRRRGTGKGTGSVWGKQGVEGESGPPASLPIAENPAVNQEKHRGRIDKGLESGGPAREYEAPPREPRLQAMKSPKPEPALQPLENLDSGNQDNGASSVLRTGPTIETALRKPVKIEKKLGPEYREEIKKHFEKLVFSKGKVGEILKAKGLEPAPRHFKDVPEKIREVLDECVNYLVDELVGKYERENVEDAILKEEFGNFPEIQMEAEKSVLAYYGDTLEDQLAKAKSAEEKEWIENQLKKLEPIKKELGITHIVQQKEEQGEASVSEKAEEKREADIFLEKVIFDAVRELRKNIDRVLALIADIDNRKKEIDITGDAKPDSRRRVLKARLFDPKNAEYIRKLDELSNLQNIDIESIKQQILSDPEIRELDDSKKGYQRREYGRRVAGRTGHVVRRIFRSDSDIGEFVRAMLDLDWAVRSKIVKVVEVEKGKEENVPEKPEMKQPAGPETESPEEKREKRIREITEGEFDEIIKHDFENMLTRWSRDKNLTVEDIANIKQEIIQGRNDIINEVMEFIFEGNKRTGMPLGTNVETLSFLGIRDKILEYAGRYVEGKAEEEKSEFSPEQMEELRDLLAVTREFRNKVERPELQEIVGGIIKEDLVSGGIFSEEEVSDAVEYVMRWANRFNDKK